MNFPPLYGFPCWTIFKRHLKTHLFRHHLTSSKKKKKTCCFISLPSPCLASIEQCLKLCIASTSCVYLPLYNESLIVFCNCKLLWIKESAKWIIVCINVSCKKKAICEHGPEAPLCPVGQGSFKIDCFKVEHFLWSDESKFDNLVGNHGQVSCPNTHTCGLCTWPLDNLYDGFSVFGPSIQVRMKTTRYALISLPDGTHL